MEIKVIGTAEANFKPDKTEIVFEFRNLNDEYKTALITGSENVKKYIDSLVNLGFKKEDCKTIRLSLNENRYFNNETRKWENNGYAYIQAIKLIFKYDIKLLTKIINMTADFENPPQYTIKYGLMDNNKANDTLYKLAVIDAKNQAKAIASASGLNLKECLRVKTYEDENDMYSQVKTEGVKSSSLSMASAGENIQNSFVPEDIVLSTSIAVDWLAE